MPAATVLLYFEEDEPSAARIAQAAGLATAKIERHRFPDGELKLRLPADLPAGVVILRTLNNPNEKLTELLLVARTARAWGATHLTLVAPYLAYMRQDIAFHPGEVVSQQVVGRFLADLFDAIVTVDPHLHRIATLTEAVPVAQASVLSGAPLLGELIARERPQALLIGPDEESAQWIARASAVHGFEYGVCRKVRHGDREVDIALPPMPVRGRSVVLLDDVASSGHTLAVAARQLLSAGALSVDVAVTHALFAGDALQVIQRAGVGTVWSTDSIAHPSNAVSLAGLIAQTLRSQNP